MINFAYNAITGLFEGREVLLAVLGGLSLLTFMGSLIVVPLVIVRLPEDYLRREDKMVKHWPRYIALAFLIFKNILGGLFLLSGLAMLILPGQGLMTLFIGLLLLDFPRKQLLIRRTLGNRRIFRSINRLRARFGKPKLKPPRASRKVRS